MKTEVNEAAPLTLRGMIGQKGVVDQVQVALNAARADDKRMDHCLLVGPGGVGKSCLAKILSQEMNSNFTEIIGENIKSPADLYSIFLQAKDKDVINIDEVHTFNFQEHLYPIIDKRTITIQAAKKTVSLKVADVTILLSTTHEFLLKDSLRSRMKLTLRYEYYEPEDLEKIVRERCKLLEWKYEQAIMPEIGKRAKGVARLALRLLQSAHRVCRSVDDTVIKLEYLKRACELEGIDSLGLDRTEQRYLQILTDGPTRLNVVSSILGLPSRTISEVTESFLLRSGLIAKDDGGKRVLTDYGVQHLSKGV